MKCLTQMDSFISSKQVDYIGYKNTNMQYAHTQQMPLPLRVVGTELRVEAVQTVLTGS